MPKLFIQAEDDFANDWSNEQIISITNQENSTLSHYLNKITLDATNFDFSVAQSDGADIRFTQDLSYYELPITITNNSSSTLTNKSIAITVTDTSVLSHLTVNGHDLRFFSTQQTNPYDEANSLSYWIDSIDISSSATIYVEIPTLTASADTTVYMYYGEQLAEPLTDQSWISSPGPVVNKSATLPTNWAYGSCVTANDGLIYCLGGNDSNWTDLNTIFAYNPTTDNVTTTSAVLPTGVSSWGDNCTLASNGKIYCFGGYSGASIDQIYSYDPVTDSSTTTVAVLPQAEYGVACATSGSYIYCFGGYDDTDYYSDILKYNPAIPNDNPVSVGNLSSESAQIDAVTGADGKIYLLGGIKKSSVTYSCSGAVPPGCFCFGPEGTCSVTETTYLETILQFDPTTNTMTTRSATLPQDRTAYSNTCALASDNNIYCLGGLENNTSAFTKNIYVYNPSGDTLTTSDQELPQAVAGHSCVKANNNNLYCLGGSIDTGTWAPNLNTISEFAESDYYATFPISFGAESIISTAQHNLAYWIESYDSTAQTATVWLDIPSLVASAVAEIKLYYGNAVASAISDQNKVNSLDSSVQKPNVIFDGDVITPTPGQVLTNCGTIDQSGNYYLSANLINRNINTCFTITANQVTLDCQGYQISGDDINNSIGIDFSQTSNVTINNCQLTDWTTGIFGRYVDYATLTNNQFSSLSGTNVLNVATGIYLTDWNADWSATGSLTNNNLIDQNQFSDIVGYGVILEGSVDDTISQNTFGTSLNNTGGRGQDHAILVKSDAQGITITNNTINRMGQIELRGCQDGVGTTLDDITISDNTISNSTNYGITFYDGISNSLIDNNTITGNSVLTDSQQGSLGGIYGEQSTSGACSSNVITTNTVSNNTISSADLFLSGPAIKLMYGDVFVVSDNNLQNSDDYLLDIRFSGSQSAQITDNQVSHGAGGIYLNGGVSQQITGNTIKNIVYYNDGAYGFLGDKNNGIKVQSIGSSSLISNNRISNTSNAGIAVLSSDQFTVSSNTIVSTRFAGILSNDSDNIIIDNNNISLVYQASGPDSLTRVGAISLGSATYNTVSNNKLFNNYQGITLRASDNNQITSNQIMNSWHYGMYLSNDSNTNNVLQSNFNCSNSTYDIYYQGGANSNSGSSNTCSSTYLWNDDGQSGCTNSCGSVFSLTDCQAISRPGIYTLQNDVSATGTCFTITADNVKIDGNDKTISYASSQSGYGISASDVEGLTIIDCQIEQTDSSVNGRGIYFSGISHSVISNNSLTNNSTGLYLINSTDNIIENNTVNSNQQGIYTDAQTITNRIKDNQVCYNTTADLQSNSNNTLLANTCDASTPTCADACAITGTTNQQSGTYIHSAQDIFQRDTISDNIILEDNKLSLAKDMTQPSQLATLNFTNSDFSRFRLSGDNVFLVNGDQQKLLSVDVSDSSSLQLLDTYTTSLNRADTIEIKGNYAYLAGCYQDGVTQDKLLAIDISNPSSPQLAYTLEDAVFCATDSYQQGDYLYVADQYVGLRVFDLSNPELPVQVNSSSPSFSPRAVSGINQHLYLIDYRSISSNDVYYLKLIDLSQPTNPQLLSSVPLTWLPTTLKVDPQEKYVLVGNASQSQLFSITYKNTITPISAQDSATINCVDAWQNYFFVGSSNQLSIYYPDATALSVYSDRQQTLSFPLSSSLADLQLTGQLASVDPIYTVKFSTDQRNLFYSTNQSFNAVGFDTYQSGSILSFTE
ncbi:MAG: DUF2341 domain-containing protein, partial [Candidatus Aenigmarchaeota archaeon]|nr:DUF2341 domain-containing protein [Candidatus Aenigmarchaeota archaeon]